LACFSCFVYMISSDDAAFPLPLSLDLQQWPAMDDDAWWLSVSVTTPHTLAQSIFLLLFIFFYLYINPPFCQYAHLLIIMVMKGHLLCRLVNGHGSIMTHFTPDHELVGLLWQYNGARPKSLTGPMGSAQLINCEYSISTHTLLCTNKTTRTITGSVHTGPSVHDVQFTSRSAKKTLVADLGIGTTSNAAKQ
jgi:hypothetical protein